ncbi:peptidoglycan recognition protein family protein [Streptomyces sp. NBC_00435]|uniref:peptidoglycan recognition protein family protein n=1 Tax=Streptomyces sp. NBC_00435 TaxID=2903649 RepID=UPI002E24A8EE
MSSFDGDAPCRGIARRAVVGAALGLGSASWSSEARASTRAAWGPEIFGCEEWGARPPTEPVTVLASPPRLIVVHHTATANVEDYSLLRAFALARAIQTHHMDTNRWIDTGQHFTVSRGAYVTEGRHRSRAELSRGTMQVRSSHCVGQNDVAVGIETEGTYSSTEPPAGQYQALVALGAYICGQYGLDPYDIRGHRDFNTTECPGDRLYALLPRLREDIATFLRGDPRSAGWTY